jgi:hypothetical protein
MAHLKYDAKNRGNSRAVRNAPVHCEVRAAMPERFLAKKKTSPVKAAPGFPAVKLLSKFNTPELIKRRSTAIAETNAGHTKKSDDALESILMGFEKLSF